MHANLEELPADVLDSLARTATRRRKPEWVCGVCVHDLTVSINIGQPEKRTCDVCGHVTRTYNVVDE